MLFVKCTYKTYMVVILWFWHMNNHISFTYLIFIFSYMPSFSWFNLKNIVASHRLCCVGWGIVNEWGVTPSFITAWAEWSVSLVSLSATSLRTMTLCPSHPPPNQMQFCCFLLTAGASFSLSLSLTLLFPLFDLNNTPVLPTTHCVDCLGGRRREKESLRLQRQRNIWLC